MSETGTPGVVYAEGFVFVNVYELDRAYGGPEEGGWYYDTGTLVTSRQVAKAYSEHVKSELEIEYPTADKAKEADYLASLADDEDAPRRPRHHRYWEVNYTGGDYRVYVEDHPGADFPEHIPHYE